MLMLPIYLGLVGPIASGKGMLIDHLKTLGFDTYSLSDVVRQEAERRGLKIEREVLQDVGDDLRQKFGRAILAEQILEQVHDPDRNIVFDSIRNPGEICYFQHLLDIQIIGVDAPVEKRIAWYLERAKKRGEDNPDMSVFIQASLRDRGVGQVATGQQVDKCLEMADIMFNNGGTKDDILKGLDRYLTNEFRFDTEIHRRFTEK